jgi:GH15 family glucan-1,4-alpha-glucosidase
MKCKRLPQVFVWLRVPFTIEAGRKSVLLAPGMLPARKEGVMSAKYEHRAFPPIEDYGLIGNCHAAALVSSRGSLDWLCLPRFDSPALFARILDLDRGGAWRINPTAPFRSAHQYVPDTNVLATTFTCDQGRARLFDFMDMTSAADTNVPGAAGRIVRLLEGVDGVVELECSCAPRPDYGRAHPQFDVHGTSVSFDRYRLDGPADWEIDGESLAATCRIALRAGERLAFVLRPADPTGTQHVDATAALAATVTYWQRWAGKCAYAGRYRDAVVRSALVLKLLTDTPTGAIVAAPTTSLPEAIGGSRNWDYRFTWIRDASFTLYALLLAGYLDADEPFFNWIVRTVKLEGTGIRVLYPIGPDGDTTERTLDHLGGYRGSWPVRIGNAAASQRQLDIYGEVLDALYFATQVGQFDPAHVWHHFGPLVDWVAIHWQEPGSGIWEVRGGLRNFVCSKAMAWVALDRGTKLAEEHSLAGDTTRWRTERDRIRAEVFAKGWSEQLGAFKQSYEDERLDASNLLLPVVGFIDGKDPRMMATIDVTLDRLVVDGLCYRYLDAPEGLIGSEATFVLCTFWLVDALILAGRAEEAQRLFERMLGRASALGLYAEEIDPATGMHLGNFPQAFSHIGVINAAVSLAHAGQIGTVPAAEAEAARASGTGGGNR